MSYVAAGVAIVGAGTAIYKGVKANQNQKKNEAQLNALTPSFYKIQDEYNQNRNIAANNAITGLPESTKNYFTTEAQRGLGTGIGALNQMSGNPNDVNRLFDTYENSIDKTAMADAQTKLANIGTFINVNKELAGQKTMQWTLNELRPYERKLKQYSQNIAAEKINQNNAANEGLSFASSYATQRSNANLMKDLFKTPQTSITNNNTQSLMYNAPTNNVAQPNPVSFQTPNVGTFATETDVRGNPLSVTPQRPSDNFQSTPAVNNPAVNPFGEGNGQWNGTQWIPINATRQGG